jgi:hypothetical protein
MVTIVIARNHVQFHVRGDEAIYILDYRIIDYRDCHAPSGLAMTWWDLLL